MFTGLKTAPRMYHTEKSRTQCPWSRHRIPVRARFPHPFFPTLGPHKLLYYGYETFQYDTFLIITGIADVPDEQFAILKSTIAV